MRASVYRLQCLPPERSIARFRFRIGPAGSCSRRGCLPVTSTRAATNTTPWWSVVQPARPKEACAERHARARSTRRRSIIFPHLVCLLYFLKFSGFSNANTSCGEFCRRKLRAHLAGRRDSEAYCKFIQSRVSCFRRSVICHPVVLYHCGIKTVTCCRQLRNCASLESIRFVGYRKMFLDESSSVLAFCQFGRRGRRTISTRPYALNLWRFTLLSSASPTRSGSSTICMQNLSQAILSPLRFRSLQE